jgi:hypothetical protein
MGRKRVFQFLRAWLFPLGYLEAAAGWLQVLWVIALLLLPAGIGGAVAKVVSGSWTTRWFIVGLLGVLLVLALAALWRATPRSSLTLTFDSAHVQTPVALDDQGMARALTRYFHFQVHSQTSVRECRGRLILVERETSSGGYDVAPEFKPPIDLTLDSVEGLRWPLIEPGLPARINLVYSQSNQAGALLCVPSHKPSGNLTTLTPGKYRLTVRVSAEGVDDVEGRFIVNVTGRWSGLEVEVAQ